MSMNVLTCEQVEEQLDLLAAGECDRPTRRAVEQHLESCAACSASYAESQRLQGMLNLHWNEAEQRERLRRRIVEEEQRTQRPRILVLPRARRAAALAAMLLVTFGLALWMLSGSDGQPAIALTVAMAPMPDNEMTRENMKMQTLVAPARAVEERMVAKFDKQENTLILPPGQSGKEYRQSLRRQRPDELPEPPSLPLELTLTNNESRSLDVRVGEEAQLALEVQGPAEGVVRLPGPKSEQTTFLPRQSLWLMPGKQRTLRVERLIEGSREHIDYVYLTEPGEYTLTIQLRAVVGRELMWMTSAPIHIHVVAR
jgi:hypothetical protein